MVFKLPKQLLFWAPRTAFYWLFLVGCRKYRCQLHSFFWSVLPERFITNLHTAGLASRSLIKGNILLVGGKREYNPSLRWPGYSILQGAKCSAGLLVVDTFLSPLVFLAHPWASFQQAQPAENIRLLIMQHRTATQVFKEQFCISTRWNRALYITDFCLQISFSFSSTA